MSSVETIFYGQVPYYSNLDESRVSTDEFATNQFSYSRQFKDEQKSSYLNYSDRKDSADLSAVKTPQEDRTQKPKMLISLLPDALNRKIQSKRSEISIYFFNSERRMTFPKEELLKTYPKLEKTTIKDFISYSVKSYCRLFLNFEPYQICEESFELKLASFNNIDDGVVQSIPINLPIFYLFQADNLVITRSKRPTERITNWRVMVSNQRPDLQIVEILMPSKKQLVEQVEKTKNINFLKEKVLSYNSQLGKIVLVSYTNLKICQGKKKVSQFEEKVFEVYREKIQDFVDKPVMKQLNPCSYNNVGYYQEILRNTAQRQDNQTQCIQVQVNQTTLYGKLNLSFFKTKIRQRYTGGLYAYLCGSERQTQLSIHSLVGLKNQKRCLQLKFIYKDREQIHSYQFEKEEKKQLALKCLLKIGRVYNKKWIKI